MDAPFADSPKIFIPKNSIAADAVKPITIDSNANTSNNFGLKV
jgi:hypothetical protein